MQAFWDQIEPAVAQVIAAALALLLAWIGYQAQKLLGININKGLTDIVKASLTTGAQAAEFKGLTGEAAVAATIAHVEASRPAELKALAMSPGVLENTAKAKVVEVAVATVAAENSNTPGSAATVAAKLP